MLICRTSDEPLIAPAVALCIQIRHEEIQHHYRMSVFIWSRALPAAVDLKRKVIFHMPGDTAGRSQWDSTEQGPQVHNEEWLVGVQLSWINIRGQAEPVNTQLLTFPEMHWMAVNTNACTSTLATSRVCRRSRRRPLRINNLFTGWGGA